MTPNAWMIVLDLAALGVLIVVLTWIKRETIAGHRHGGTPPPLDTREPRATWATIGFTASQKRTTRRPGLWWATCGRAADSVGEPEPLVLEPRRELGPGE